MFEGDYLSLGEELWKEATAFMEELWALNVEMDTARLRLVKRHARDEQNAVKKVEENDLGNGREIFEFMLKVQELITSVGDENWKG